MPRHPSRRALMGGAALSTLLAACSGAETVPGDGDPSEPGWSFTDDLGVTITLDAPPTRIAGVTDAIIGLWNYGIEPVAVYGTAPIEDDVGFAGRDLTDVATVGEAYGEINVEGLAAARPDLIVELAYPTARGRQPSADDTRFGYADASQQRAAERIAPIVTLAVTGTVDTVAGRSADLAAALGVDTELLDGYRRDFSAAADRLAAAADPGLSLLFVAGYDAELYVAHPQDDPTLAYYGELGLTMTDPAGGDFYWSTYSWETVDELSADVLLTTPRAMSPDQLLAHPTFAALPAAAAGQIVSWEARSVDLVAQTGYMDALASALEGMRRVT